MDLYVLWNAYHKLFCVFGDFYMYASGTQDTEVTTSLNICYFFGQKSQ